MVWFVDVLNTVTRLLLYFGYIYPLFLIVAQGQLSALRASFDCASQEKAVMQDSLIAAKDEIHRLHSLDQAANLQRQQYNQISFQNEELQQAKTKLESQCARANEECERLAVQLKDALEQARLVSDRAVADAALVAATKQREEKAASELEEVRRQVIASRLSITV
jgi:hypothetical protein